MVARWHCNHTVTSPSERTGREGGDVRMGTGMGRRIGMGLRLEMGMGTGMGPGLELGVDLEPRLTITTKQPRMLLGHLSSCTFYRVILVKIWRNQRAKAVK